MFKESIVFGQIENQPLILYSHGKGPFKELDDTNLILKPRYFWRYLNVREKSLKTCFEKWKISEKYLHFLF